MIGDRNGQDRNRDQPEKEAGRRAIQHFVDSASQVQVGIDATTREMTGYIAILVEGAEGLGVGERVPATFDVDGSVFKGTFVGQQTGSFGGATVAVDNANFLYDFTNKALTISYGEGKRVIVDLTDADAAFASLRSCQEAQ